MDQVLERHGGRREQAFQTRTDPMEVHAAGISEDEPFRVYLDPSSTRFSP
jgi:hypothetical protein